jgi:hypothetical protein
MSLVFHMQGALVPTEFIQKNLKVHKKNSAR